MLAHAMVMTAGSWAVAALVMAGLWVVARRIRNHGIVDVGWTYLVGGLALAHAGAGAGAGPRRALVAAMFGVWAVRLGTYLLRDRVLGRPEDGRYAALRQSWGDAADARFFWFYQAQAAAAAGFAIPALFPSMNRSPSIVPLEWAAALLWAMALAGEALADWQLARFKAQPGHRGLTCRAGLWRYSRHPNYFFEWTVWVAFALFSAASPLGTVAVACPLAMLYLLFKVTGIPATEAQAVRSRGEDYRRYQATTSVFVPWWPRAAPVEVAPR